MENRLRNIISENFIGSKYKFPKISTQNNYMSDQAGC